MRIILAFNEQVDNELLEKVRNVKSYDEYAEIAYEYGEDDTLTAFRETHKGFDDNYIIVMMEKMLFEENLEDVVNHFIEATNKEND